MKFCTDCGAENNDGVNFCSECAHAFNEVKEVKEVKEVNEIKVEKKSFMGLIPEKYTKIAIILASCLPILLIAFFVGKSMYLNANPVLKVLNGVQEMVNDNELSGQAVVNLKLEDQSDEAELIEDIALLVDFKLKEDDYNTKYTLMLEENEIFETVVAVKKNVVYLDLLDYHEDVFFYQNTDIDEQVEIAKEALKYLEYMKLKGVDSGKYIDIIEKEMKGNISSKGGMVVVDFDAKDIIELLEELLDEALDDDDLKNALHKDLVKMLNAMKKDNFEYTFNEGSYSEQEFSEEMMDLILDTIESDDDFDELYERALEELISGFKYEARRMDDDFSMELAFNFNMFNKIKSVEATAEMDDDKVISTINFGKTYRFKKLTMKKSVDIEDIIDDDEMFDLIEDVGENFIDKFTDNEDNVDFIEDTDIFENYEDRYGSSDGEEFLEYMWSELFHNLSYFF